MPVNAINFLGKRDNITALINLDDNTIKQAAYVKTLQEVDTKKYKKVDKVLNLALPVAGGLASASYMAKGKRLAAFGKGFGSWAFFLAGMGAIFGLSKVARDKSEKINDFSNKYSILYTLTTALGAFVAGTYAIKGGFAGIKKLANTSAFKTVAKKGTELLTNFKSKPFIANSTKKVSDFVSKTPAAIKEVANFVANVSPLFVILGSWSNSVKNATKVNDTYYKNYNDLKEFQLKVAQARTRELEIQNDFLLTKPENVEDLKEVGL